MFQINSIKKAESRLLHNPASAKCLDDLAAAHMKRANVMQRFNMLRGAIAHYTVMEIQVGKGAKIPAHELARAYHRLGKIYLALDKLDEARTYFNKAYDLARETHLDMGRKYTREESVSLLHTMKWAKSKLKQVDAREKELARAIPVY